MFSGLDNGLIVAFIKQIQFNLHTIDISRNVTAIVENIITDVNTKIESYRNNMAYSKYKMEISNIVIESDNTTIAASINKITAGSLKMETTKSNIDSIRNKIAAVNQPIGLKTQ